MKVCLINNLYKPYAVGGAEKVVEERTKKYFLEGNEVFIITSQPFKSWSSLIHQKTFEEGVIIYRFYPLNIFWYKDLNKHNFFLKLVWHFFDIFNCWSTRIIKKILLLEKPDVIETHNLMGLGVYKVHKIIKSIKSDAKWLHYIHDVQLVEPSGVLPWNHKKDSWYQKIYSRIMKWRMGNPDVVISPSEFLKKFYQSRGFFKQSEWRVEKYCPLLTKEGVGGGLNNPSVPSSGHLPFVRGGQVNFLFVGSLVPHKGIHILMQAWNMVCHSRESGNPEIAISLHIVGDGILKTEVEEWAKDKSGVVVYGRLEKEELEKVYENCDILIFPSICLENRPTVILEALQHGLSIIASDTGGVRELVRPNENAWLFEPGNVPELVKRMKRFI